MKKVHYLLLAVLSLTIFSCQKSMVDDEQISENQKELIIEETIQSTILDDLLSDIDLYSELGEGWAKSAEIEGGCPLVTIERPGSAPFWPRKITLDFGDGCEKNGKVKSGIMVIEKSAPWKDSGAKREVTFDNYKVDDVSIEGKKELKNITEDGGNPTFKIEANLTLTSKNDSGEVIVVTRKVEKEQEWLAGFGDRAIPNQISLTGESNIVKTVGSDEKTIKKEFNAILIVQGCRFPQSGVTDFKVKTYDGLELQFALDYGTEGSAGEKCKENCDCYATLSSGDGSEDIDLSDKWWKKARESK